MRCPKSKEEKKQKMDLKREYKDINVKHVDAIKPKARHMDIQ